MAFSRWQYWRRFNLPNVVYLLILIAIAGASFWWVRKDSAPKSVTQNQQPERMDGYADRAELTQTSDNGKLLYQATMNHIEHFGNQNPVGRRLSSSQLPMVNPKWWLRRKKLFGTARTKLLIYQAMYFCNANQMVKTKT